MTEGHFEAIKYAYRQSKDGFVLSFVVHPSDMPDVLATAPIGSRFMVAFASLGDAPTREDGVADVGSNKGPGAARRSSPASSGPLPALDNGPAESGAANTGANAAPLSKPNSSKAVMMAKDPEFQRFSGTENEGEAEAFIKLRCRVSSKRELNEGVGELEFRKLRLRFRDWRALPEPKGP